MAETWSVNNIKRATVGVVLLLEVAECVCSSWNWICANLVLWNLVLPQERNSKATQLWSCSNQPKNQLSGVCRLTFLLRNDLLHTLYLLEPTSNIHSHQPHVFRSTSMPLTLGDPWVRRHLFGAHYHWSTLKLMGLEKHIKALCRRSTVYARWQQLRLLQALVSVIICVLHFTALFGNTRFLQPFS